MNRGPVLPGSVIGCLGGGQLGRMFALSARRMGYRVHTVDPTPDSPAGQISDREFNVPFTDIPALLEFASGVSVVTYEFENIPVAALDALAPKITLRPGRDVLYTTQNRQREKEFLRENQFPVGPFRVVNSEPELRAAVAALGFPCVLKTADFGYDGKGQQKISKESDLGEVWRRHGNRAGVIEAWINYQAELSVVVARGVPDAGGNHQVQAFPPALNEHENHILATSVAPAPLAASIAARAQHLAASIATRLGVIGLLAVEFFLTRQGELLVNELAPRPHNSGHYSFDACVTGQFEQQLRAVCGLPLGDPRLKTPVVMRNLLGDIWANGEPDWPSLLALSGLRLHLYGKSEPRSGRKMGHYCVLDESLDRAWEIDARAQAILKGPN
ncbi:MAG TPA: 5-(carboxyamino)imidazole ribonucleotide synthase [Candidatus Methylacidiphilales bacterium]|nr:5-(carboxyamino)imidazole ribonucleotide synthase [Candidatus Methylacidiphilales bacterium]